MRRNETICDRCGKTKTIQTDFDVITSFAQINLWGVGEDRTDIPQTIEICKECYEKFVNYLEGGAE